jgi:hypothetical protein
LLLATRAVGSALGARLWNISTSISGAYVQYDGSKIGNERFSGLAIDLLKELANLRANDGETFNYTLIMLNGSESRDWGALESHMEAYSSQILWSGDRVTSGLLSSNLRFAPYDASGLVLVRENNPTQWPGLRTLGSLMEVAGANTRICAQNQAIYEYIQSNPKYSQNSGYVLQLEPSSASVESNASVASNISVTRSLGEQWQTSLEMGRCTAVVADEVDAHWALGSMNCTLSIKSKQAFWSTSLGVGVLKRPNLVLAQHQVPCFRVRHVYDTPFLLFDNTYL